MGLEEKHKLDSKTDARFEREIENLGNRTNEMRHANCSYFGVFAQGDRHAGPEIEDKFPFSILVRFKGTDLEGTGLCVSENQCKKNEERNKTYLFIVKENI